MFKATDIEDRKVAIKRGLKSMASPHELTTVLKIPFDENIVRTGMVYESEDNYFYVMEMLEAVLYEKIRFEAFSC